MDQRHHDDHDHDEDEQFSRLLRKLDTLAALLRKMVPEPPGPAVRLKISIGPITKQGEQTMQIHDNEQFDITVDAVDSKGVPTPEAFTATSSDENVVTVVDSDSDGRTFTIVAGLPGSAVVTIAEVDGGPLTATEAVDVVPGDAAAITITEGPVSTQP